MLLDKLKQKSAERKSREARNKAGSATGARARLLEVEDPKPTPPPTGRFAKVPQRTDAPHAERCQDSRRDYVEVEVEDVKALTARAALCVIEGDEHWLPLSEMYEPGVTFDKRGQCGTIYLPEWLAEEKGLI